MFSMGYGFWGDCRFLAVHDSEHGSILGIPVCEKGPRGVRYMIKEIVKHTMAFADDNPIFQSDGENSIRAVVLAAKACRAKLGLASRDRVATSKQANGGAERTIRELRTGGMTLLACLEEKLEAKVGHTHVLAVWRSGIGHGCTTDIMCP